MDINIKYNKNEIKKFILKEINKNSKGGSLYLDLPTFIINNKNYEYKGRNFRKNIGLNHNGKKQKHLLPAKQLYKILSTIENIKFGYYHISKDKPNKKRLTLFTNEKDEYGYPIIIGIEDNQIKSIYNRTSLFIDNGLINFETDNVVKGSVEIVYDKSINPQQFLLNLSNQVLEAKKNLNKELQENNITIDKNSEKEKLYKLYRDVCDIYKSDLKHYYNKKARDYLYDRKINDKDIDKFEIGYAQESPKYLYGRLINLGHDKETIEKSNLFSSSDKYKRKYPKFRNRITFPLKDEKGHIVGFSCRSIDPQEKQYKYLHSATSIVFDKSKILFGYDVNKDAIKSKKDVVICEGNFDVIAYTKAGIPAVAALGVALSDYQVELLAKQSNKNITLAFDNDKAGEIATFNVINHLFNNDILPNTFTVTNGKDAGEIIEKYGSKELLKQFNNNVLDSEKSIIKIVDNMHNAYYQSTLNRGNYDPLEIVFRVSNMTNNLSEQTLNKVFIALAKTCGLSLKEVKKLYSDFNKKKQDKVIKQQVYSKKTIEPKNIKYTKKSPSEKLKDAYDQTAKVLLAYIKKNNQMPWSDYRVTTPPFNANNGYEYTNMNKLVLFTQSINNNYKTQQWLPLGAIKANKDISINKGEKATKIFIPCISEVDDLTKPLKAINGSYILDKKGNIQYEKKRIIKGFKTASVFNVQQLSFYNNAQNKLIDKSISYDKKEDLDRAFKPLFNNPPCPIYYNNNIESPHYNPNQDIIVLPNRESYSIQEKFYSTAWHEASHATGHESRLGRSIKNRFGSKEYALEELRAEMSAAMKMFNLNYTCTLSNSANYIKSWTKALDGDNAGEFLKVIKEDVEKIHKYLNLPDSKQRKQYINYLNKKNSNSVSKTINQDDFINQNISFGQVMNAATELKLKTADKTQSEDIKVDNNRRIKQ